ncbi:MAG: HAD hydrolase-like protein [Tissierellia bacterium]|nr:HAD hydrolase-like protein [Tissierellia bacterium]
MYWDGDGTIFDSSKAFCTVYNFLYKNYDDFIPANSNLLNSWDFHDICPLLYKYKNHSVEEIFGMKELFDNLELFPLAYEVLKELSKKYELWLVTIGNDDNLYNKIPYVKYKLPFIKNKLYINNATSKMDKSMLNTPFAPFNSIFIDDVYKNLISANVQHKYCFGKVYSFNEEWTGQRLYNYIDVANRFLK